MFYKIFLYIIIFFVNLFSQNITISNITNNTNILKYSYYFIDIDSKKDFNYIRTHSNIFKPYKKDFISQGYTTNTIWLKFSIYNDTSKIISKFLEIDNNMIDEIILYKKTNNKYKIEKKGILNRKEFDSFLRFKFQINIMPNQTKEYYLKTKSITSGLYFHLNLLDEKDFYKKDIKHQHILILFFGAILALTFYNFMIFLITKDKSHLFYSLYMLFTVIMQVTFHSMNLYILPIEFEYYSAYLGVLYNTLTVLFAILFTKEFLTLKKYTKINLSLNIIIALHTILAILSFYPTFFYLDLSTFLAIISISYLFFISVYLLFQKNENALYFATGWFISIFAYIMLGFKQANLWSMLDYFPYFFEISILIEALLFAYILSKKLTKTKELEKSLNTNKLLLKELHHRIKNNMQFIISLYRLKLNNCDINNIEQKLSEAEISIQAMSSIHELLYHQNNLQSIDTNKFFTELINKIESSFNKQNIKISTNFSINLDIQESIYCGIILNELLTNSFKYAFPNQNGSINISLVLKQGIYYFNIKDNGIGFDYNSKIDESFGLNFINAIVEDKLNGKIKFDCINKTDILITFK
jgi:two-component sensor histidine kinase